MARLRAAGRTVTNLPTAARGPGLFSGASGGRWFLREVKVTNTTVTAVCVGIAICTATGTQVGAVTEYQTDTEDTTPPTSAEVAFLSQSTDSTVAAVIDQADLGAAIGSGYIFRYDPGEIVIPEGIANGIIITCPTGTAQHLDFTFAWEK